MQPRLLPGKAGWTLPQNPFSSAAGIRTRVPWLKTMCPRPLDDSAIRCSDSAWGRTRNLLVRSEMPSNPFGDRTIVERDGIRTRGLFGANEALFQLSYTPIE